MSDKKNILWKVLWFMVGMAVIISIPLLLIDQCSQTRKADIRKYEGIKLGSVNDIIEKHVIRGNVKPTQKSV